VSLVDASNGKATEAIDVLCGSMTSLRRWKGEPNGPAGRLGP
jgi:hypothetical protein